MRFGISTHLFHEERLRRDHLAAIAAHGFEAIELFATRSHVDYHDESAIAELATWLRETGLRLHGIHAPVAATRTGSQWSPLFSTAAADAGRRAEAVREIEAALAVARRVPADFLVVHLGVPAGGRASPADNSRAAAVRSVEEVHALAEPLGVRVALEVIPNEMSSAAALAALLEEDVDAPGAGICLDFGHALLAGDVIEAVEAASGHLLTTHVHDNHGERDEHLVPFEGVIDWAAALMAAQKIGYDGVWVLEVGGAGDPGSVLERARRARERLERT